MKSLSLPAGPLKLLALGAHSDDIEIGAGGTILRLAAERRADLEVLWVVFCGAGPREEEARASAAAFLDGVSHRVEIHGHRDGFLPFEGAAVKEAFEDIKRRFDPDLVLTHYRDDRHQDHRTVSDLTWNTWRRHLVLEYEIPKYDGDLGIPNSFAPLPEAVLERKIELLMKHFATQRSRTWFEPSLFRALPRIRGMECAAPSGLAEAFYLRKATF